MKKFLYYLRKLKDFPEGLTLLGISVVLLLILPTQVPKATRLWGVKPTLPGGHRLFPIISLCLLGITGIIIIISALKKKVEVKSAIESEEKVDLKGMLLTALSWIAYAIGVLYLGYIFSTFVILIILMRAYGIKNWVGILSVAVGTNILLYLIFVWFLKLPFSQNPLFF